MKTKLLFKRMLLSFSMVMLISINLKAQNSATDFWSAFEVCTGVPEFQSHYPALASNQTRMHAVMNHGITIPSLQGITFSQIAVGLYDKSTMLAMQKTEFFILHDYQIDGNNATFDVVYYYNFNGTYDSFVSAVIKTEKVNGVWTLKSTTIK